MRVGIFTNAYRPFISGVVNSIDIIRKGLLKHGHTPFIFAPEYKGHSDEHAGVFRFRSVEMSRKVQFPIPIPFSSRIFPIIARMDLDVIHTHHPLLLGDVGAHFARKLKLPLVYTFHTQLEHYSHYIPLNQQVVRSLARNTVTAYTQKCDLVLAPSPTIRALLDEYEVGTRVETLQNAIDLSLFEDADGGPIRQRLGLASEDVLGMYAGRLGVEKNLDFLLEAFAGVSRQNSRAHLMVVGTGAELDKLKSRPAELGCQGKIHFTGPIDYSQMPAHFAAADLFAITSTTEVKPLVVLEAMASGLPVVAVAACGTQDTLTDGHDGWLCPHQLPAYQASLSQAYHDRVLRQALGANARGSVAQYSAEGYTTRLVELYQELIAAKGGCRTAEMV